MRYMATPLLANLEPAAPAAGAQGIALVQSTR